MSAVLRSHKYSAISREITNTEYRHVLGILRSKLMCVFISTFTKSKIVFLKGRHFCHKLIKELNILAT